VQEPQAWQTHRMNPPAFDHRLYFRFCLNSQEVEALLSVRGVIGSYDAMRTWCHTGGQTYV